ncbi:putative MFS family arabinose efflux permease [Lipingzhangella halophila]|uniref:Putative MFS family arabinose efflux permease n=1 Tax=Lipingzhangella halophila TaxID=1783352 RepID=A0A7W7RKI2_9ACTN|nr:MFS transporter [Lipingzhangella halophila]MBB4933248.1 putative MFS family arabinose efflux permease [Lipingzhangella halophila]
MTTDATIPTGSSAAPGGRRTAAPGIPVWLLALTVAAFATGTDDMIIAGILPLVSADLDVTEATAGQLVTVYSLTYGLGAPVMAVVAGRVPHHRLLPAMTALFAIANILMALAPSYPVAMGLRVATALAAATLIPAALVAVGRHAPADRKARYLSLVTAGITLSLVVGVPIGSWIGAALGWRATMLFVAALSLPAFVGMLWLPRGDVGPQPSLRQRAAPLKRPVILGTTLALLISGAGGMMPYIYLAPLYRQLSGGTETVGTLIMLFGAAGFVGVLLGGRGADRWGAGRTLAAGLGTAIAMVAVLAVLAAVVPAGSLPFAVLAGIVVVWAVGIWTLSPPLQSWLLRRAQGADSAILALNTSGMYLGFSLAGSLGGLALATGGPVALPWASVILLVAGGGVLLVAFTRLARRENLTAERGS